MISPQESRGAAPIGHMHELPPLEMLVIVYLRMWCEGGPSRVQMRKNFILALGQNVVSLHSSTFASFMLVLIHKSRRNIMRHQATCKCFGGDESDIEEALLFTSHLVPSKTAHELMQPAEEVGLAFDQMLGQEHYQALLKHKTPKTKH